MNHLVLIVDDHEDSRKIYASMLAHLEYRVIEASSGQEVLDSARSELPDVILMDMSMPGSIDGWAATSVLKMDPRTAHIPIIALTAHAFSEDRLRARQAGCDEYLAKPAHPRLVADAVQRVVARTGPA